MRKTTFLWGLTGLLLTADLGYVAAMASASPMSVATGALWAEPMDFSQSELAVIPVDLDRAVKREQTPPIKIEADSMYYSDMTGKVEGKGNVDVYRLKDVLHAPLLTGNAKTQQYVAPDGARMITPISDLTGSVVSYDGLKKQGQFQQVEGKYGDYYVKGKVGFFEDGVGHIEHGMITTPSALAKVPDYRMEGDDIKIYPNDKLVAEQVRFYFKNFIFLTMDHFVTSLKKDDSRTPSVFSFLPRPDYKSEYGFGGHARFDYPLGSIWNMDVSYYLYTKLGFKPSVQFSRNISVGRFTFGYQSAESTLNDNNIWVRKFPEAAINFKRYYLGDSHIYASGNTSWGYWKEGNTEGSHANWNTYLSHDPIKLSSNTTLIGQVGYMKDYYGAGSKAEGTDVRGDAYYNINLNYKPANRLNTYVGYINNNLVGHTPYGYDNIDVARKVYGGFTYQIDRLDSIGVYVSKNVVNGNVDDINYTWDRDLHSFTAQIMYKQKESKWEFHIQAKDF